MVLVTLSYCQKHGMWHWMLATSMILEPRNMECEIGLLVRDKKGLGVN